VVNKETFKYRLKNSKHLLYRIFKTYLKTRYRKKPSFFKALDLFNENIMSSVFQVDNKVIKLTLLSKYKMFKQTTINSIEKFNKIKTLNSDFIVKHYNIELIDFPNDSNQKILVEELELVDSKSYKYNEMVSILNVIEDLYIDIRHEFSFAKDEESFAASTMGIWSYMEFTKDLSKLDIIRDGIISYIEYMESKELPEEQLKNYNREYVKNNDNKKIKMTSDADAIIDYLDQAISILKFLKQNNIIWSDIHIENFALRKNKLVAIDLL